MTLNESRRNLIVHVCPRSFYVPMLGRQVALSPIELEGRAMNSESQGDRTQPKLPVAAIVLGSIATLVTAGAVSWATPDGNLVVTLVPALAVGLAVFGIALWRFRRGESE
jgi:hypothetical protein